MKKLKSLIKGIWSIFSVCFTIYVVILIVQGKNVKEEIFSWFDNTVTIESVMEKKGLTREEAFNHIIETTDPEDLPDVLTDMKDHVLLNTRNAGISATLTGDVRVIVIFTNVPSASWTDEEMTKAQSDLEDMTNKIMTEAASYGADLDLSLAYYTGSVFIDEPLESSTYWEDTVLSSAGLSSLDTASRDLEREYDLNNAPIVFCMNYTDRSYARPQYDLGRSECVFLYQDANGVTGFSHELYHLFGAKDFYYPADVKSLAETYFPKSSMLTSEDSSVDDLTAYLIGWTDVPSADALSFLQETAYLTSEYMLEQHDLETFTGYVEDYDTGDGLYTGDLDYGIPQGNGTKVWDDGAHYEGGWDFGNLHGEGTYTWANGTTYTGSWNQGQQHGTGTMTWSDGTSYTGEWVNGIRHGYGTYTWPDGSIYEGDWENGSQHGYGTMTLVDSGTYTGYFSEGSREGEGTYTWNNGDSFTGEWLDGQRTGYGTYTWADGGELSGYWENNEFIE